MNPQDFNNIFQGTIMELERLVSFKGKQYAKETNRLHNFDRAAKLYHHANPIYSCFGMWSKQLVSLVDAIETEVSRQTPDDSHAWSQERCDEVINDLLLYLILTKALFYRAYGWKTKSIPIRDNRKCTCPYPPTETDPTHFVFCPSSPPTYGCSICRVKYLSENELLTHNQQEHP